MSTIHINVMERGGCRLPRYCEGVKRKEISTLSTDHVTHANVRLLRYATVFRASQQAIAADTKLFRFAKHLHVILLFAEHHEKFIFMLLFELGAILLEKIVSYFVVVCASQQILMMMMIIIIIIIHFK
jgi:hypothetical protein